jgi:hypothetical protein
MRVRNTLSMVFSTLGSLLLVSPTWIGAVLPTATVAVSHAEAQPVNTAPAALDWNPAWGEKLVGTGTPLSPFITVDPADANLLRTVKAKQNVAGALGTVKQFGELGRTALPNYGSSSTLTVQETPTSQVYDLTITVVNSMISTKGTDANGNSVYSWGVLTQSRMDSSGRSDKVKSSQYFEAYFPYGITTTGDAAISAAQTVGQVVAVTPAPAPSCYSQCMAGEHARHFQNMLDCLTASGVGGGAGASVCILGCLGTGPGYPACVTGCLSAVGVTVGVLGAACVMAYVAAMTGAAIGCAIGCWTSW